MVNADPVSCRVSTERNLSQLRGIFFAAGAAMRFLLQATRRFRAGWRFEVRDAKLPSSKFASAWPGGVFDQRLLDRGSKWI